MESPFRPFHQMAQLQQCCIPGEKSLAMLGPSAYLRIYQREDPEIASQENYCFRGRREQFTKGRDAGRTGHQLITSKHVVIAFHTSHFAPAKLPLNVHWLLLSLVTSERNMQTILRKSLM